MYERLLAGRRRVLGNLHPDTFITRSNIATLLGRENRHVESEQIYRGVYEDEVQVLGPKHPATLNSLQYEIPVATMPNYS